jgi:predicted GTPase
VAKYNNPMPVRVIIMGAAGKDFHVFNTCYKNNPEYRVIAFTATQIPNIDERRYPSSLAGPLYPEGIPIHNERFLARLIRENNVQEVIFAYSDISYEYMKKREEVARKAGAEFKLFDIEKSTLKSNKSVIAVCAVRTGSGKSPTTRKVVRLLKEAGKKVAVVRHPMPYGNLEQMEVQKFETLEDLKKHDCTIEEMEEYEPHLKQGSVVFAGVDYEKILKIAQDEFEVIVWDGGNNDLPFYKPDLHITVADAIRAGHELNYFPGRLNFEMADVILISKVSEANPEDVNTVIKHANELNPDAKIIKSDLVIQVERAEEIKDKRVLAIEDGPSVTHGETKYGAAFLAAKKFGAREIVDPRNYATGSLCNVFEQYPHIERVLPAMGYGRRQIRELEQTINNADCDIVIIGTPVDLGRVLKINKPYVRVTYEIQEVGTPVIKDVLTKFL